MVSEVELLEDIITIRDKKPHHYGKKGQKAKVIAEHGNVLIVELKERFSVHISKTKSND